MRSVLILAFHAKALQVINQLISGQLNRPLLQDLEEDITDWVHTGNIGKLEELVLNGYADLLLGRNHQVVSGILFEK